MTITDTGRQSVDELLPAARDLAREEGGVPPKDRLKRVFRIGWSKATEIHDRLNEEVDQRRRDGRRRMRAVRTRKAPARGLGRRPTPLPDLPMPLAATPVAVQVSPASAPLSMPSPRRRRSVPRWPLLLLALPAFVAIWSGWVGLGELTGFGVMHPLPGIADRVAINTAITLPIGLETYAAYALFVWLSGAVPARARRFARASAIGSLVLGAGGQVAYHLMAAAGMTAAPWWITTVVSCLPVAVVGMGAALYHLVSTEEEKSWH